MDTFAQFLKKKRLEQGYTQKEVAAYLGGFKPQLIANFERGATPLPLKHVKRLAKLYNVPAERLYEGLTNRLKARIERASRASR